MCVIAVYRSVRSHSDKEMNIAVLMEKRKLASFLMQCTKLINTIYVPKTCYQECVYKLYKC